MALGQDKIGLPIQNQNSEIILKPATPSDKIKNATNGGNQIKYIDCLKLFFTSEFVGSSTSNNARLHVL